MGPENQEWDGTERRAAPQHPLPRYPYPVWELAPPRRRRPGVITNKTVRPQDSAEVERKLREMV